MSTDRTDLRHLQGTYLRLAFKAAGCTARSASAYLLELGIEQASKSRVDRILQGDVVPDGETLLALFAHAGADGVAESASAVAGGVHVRNTRAAESADLDHGTLRLMQAVGAVASAVTEATADRVVDQSEAEGIDNRLAEAERRIAEMRARLRPQVRRPSLVAK